MLISGQSRHLLPGDPKGAELVTMPDHADEGLKRNKHPRLRFRKGGECYVEGNEYLRFAQISPASFGWKTYFDRPHRRNKEDATSDEEAAQAVEADFLAAKRGSVAEVPHYYCLAWNPRASH